MTTATYALRDDLCTPTFAMIDRVAQPDSLSDALALPSRAEALLSSKLITDLSRFGFEESWKARKQVSGETHCEAKKSFDELSSENINFIRHLNTGKLMYLLTYVSREGLENLLALGEHHADISDLESPQQYLPHQLIASPGQNETIRETLGRLEHENWLNQNGLLKRVHDWNYEWGQYPDDKRYGYELSCIQADCDLIGLASLNSVQRELLLSHSQPGDGVHFFHPDLYLTVRNPSLQVVASDAGARFERPFSVEDYTKAAAQMASTPDNQELYDSHSLFDRMQMPLKEREVIARLFFDQNGSRVSDSDVIDIGLAFQQIKRSGIDLRELSAEETLTQVRAITEGKALYSPLRMTWSQSHLSFAESFDPAFQDRWAELLYHAVHRIGRGFPVGNPDLKHGKAINDLLPAQQLFRREISSGILSLLQSYHYSTIDGLRSFGEEMIALGLQGVRNGELPASRGLLSADGEMIAFPVEFSNNLAYQLRRLALDTAEFRRHVPSPLQIRRWSRAKESAHRSSEVTEQWEKDFENLYAIALTTGALTEQDFQILRTGCSRTGG